MSSSKKQTGARPRIVSSNPRQIGASFPASGAVAMVRRKPIPHAFALDALVGVGPRTRPMFGCIAVYVGEKIVLLLRDRPDGVADNGVWLATDREHHASLRREFPSMRSIQLFGKEVTGWQILPADALDFEQSVLHACELVTKRDPRIGKVPKGMRPFTPSNGRASRKPSQSSF